MVYWWTLYWYVGQMLEMTWWCSIGLAERRVLCIDDAIVERIAAGTFGCGCVGTVFICWLDVRKIRSSRHVTPINQSRLYTHSVSVLVILNWSKLFRRSTVGLEATWIPEINKTFIHYGCSFIRKTMLQPTWNSLKLLLKNTSLSLSKSRSTLDVIIFPEGFIPVRWKLAKLDRDIPKVSSLERFWSVRELADDRKMKNC